MSDDDLLEHLELVKRRVEALDPARAAAFGLLCTERQLPALSRAARFATWAQPLLPEIRRALDAMWRQLESLGSDTAQVDPPEIPLAPDDIIASGEDGRVTSSDTVAYFLLHAFSNLLAAIHEGDPTYSHYSAARNLDTIEMLLDEVRLPPDQSEAMMATELARQLQNLDALEATDSPVSLRPSHAGPDIYAGVWFHRDT